MRQESWVQIISIAVLVVLSIFYNPLKATLEGKFIFAGVIFFILLFFVVSDIYKKLKSNEIKVKLFDDKMKFNERIKKLEDWKENLKNMVPRNKRGAISPVMIIVIIIIILIYLYIKSQQ